MTKAELFNTPRNTEVMINEKLYRVADSTRKTVSFEAIMHYEYLTLDLKDSPKVTVAQ